MHLADAALLDRETCSREGSGGKRAAEDQQHGNREKYEDAQGQEHLPTFVICIEFLPVQSRTEKQTFVGWRLENCGFTAG